jgi:hypothetical protein
MASAPILRQKALRMLVLSMKATEQGDFAFSQVLLIHAAKYLEQASSLGSAESAETVTQQQPQPQPKKDSDDTFRWIRFNGHTESLKASERNVGRATSRRRRRPRP